MPAGLAQGLRRAVECPTMTTGGCFSSRRTFRSLMELWTRTPSSVSGPEAKECVCVHKCECVNVCMRFTSYKALKVVALPNIQVPLKHGQSNYKLSPVTPPSHTHTHRPALQLHYSLSTVQIKQL